MGRSEKRKKQKEKKIAEVLYRLYGEKARTLSDTILWLIPRSEPSVCKCKSRGCLSCVGSPLEFLIRPSDPTLYKKLLYKCIVVVNHNVDPIKVYYSHRVWPQYTLVARTIEIMRRDTPPLSNVLCADCHVGNHSKTSLELLTCSAWDRLLKRVGDEFMVYLLKYTSIFLPSTRGNYSQVSGSPVNDLFFKRHWKGKRKGCSGVKKAKVDKTDSILEIDPSAFVEYGTSSNTSCISCNTVNKRTSCSRNIENKKHWGNISRESTLNICISGDNKNVPSAELYQESTNQVEIKSQKHKQLPTRCSKNTQNKKQQKNGSGEATLSTGIMCADNEKLPNKDYQESLNEVQTKNAQVRESSWQRRKKRKRSAVQDNNFYSQNEINVNISNVSSGSVHSVSNFSCSCCLMLQTFLDVTTESRVDKWFLFYDLIHSPSTFARKHILNTSKANLSDATALMKNIFGLSDESTKHLSQPCVHSSNCCFNNSTCLYHTLLKLLRKLICKAKRCKHKALLEKHCPIPPSIQNAESCSNDCQENSLSSELLPTQCYSSQKQVVSFVWAVCRAIIPLNLFGMKSSWRILRRNISRFVRLRRFEAFPLRHGMHKLKLSMFPFLSNGHSLCPLNANIPNWTILRHNILKKWMFWFFAKLVIPLLRAHFYVTESEQGKHDVFYFRKPIWRIIMDNTVMRSEDQSHYRPIKEQDVRNISGERKFGFSKVRLLPKGSSVRVLVNLKAKSRLSSDGKVSFCSVNSKLRELHAVLKGKQLKEPDMLGSSVFSYTDVHIKLSSFLLSLKNGSTSIPTVFIVVADVRKAFDSINQDKLLDILDGLLQDDVYLLKKSHQVTCKKKSLWIDQNYFLAEEDMGKEYSKPSSALCGVLVNQGWSSRIKKEKLKFILKEHVKRNILRLDCEYYMQCVGIAQGSILSPLLCSFYYGDLENKVILPSIQKSSAGDFLDHKSMLVRFIDDYLFISTSKEQAASFFSMLNRGFPEYNCTLNQMKFGRNFDIAQLTGISANTVYVGEDGISFLQWSGLFINCDTLEIQVDYTRYLKIHISSTLTICWEDKPSSRLKSKLCGYLRARSHPIFYDSNINSPVVVRLNIYQAFLLCAMKFHCYVCELFTVCRLDAHSCFGIIEKSLRFMYMCAKNRMLSTRSDSTKRSHFHVEKREVEWLGIMAYIRVLLKKETRHKELLSLLKSRLASHEKVMHVSSHLIEAVDDLHSSVMWKIKF